jgi:ribosomal subunit interface protein
MKVTVQGHHIDVGEALKTHITEKLSAINEKYFNRAINVTVTMSKDAKSQFKAHVAMTVGKDIHVQATDMEHDVYAAFDNAAEKIAKQLRRHKRKLREHQEQKESAEALRAAEYTLGYTISDDKLDQVTDEELDEQADAIVVAEMTTNIQTMTVSEAAMRLSLSGNNALMFNNASHGEINMVYVRKDGNIGWVDPKETVDAKSKVA